MEGGGPPVDWAVLAPHIGHETGEKLYFFALQA